MVQERKERISILLETLTPRPYEAEYLVRSSMDRGIVSTGTVQVEALNAAEANVLATQWVHDHDPNCDERIDPLVEILHTHKVENDEEPQEIE